MNKKIKHIVKKLEENNNILKERNKNLRKRLIPIPEFSWIDCENCGIDGDCEDMKELKAENNKLKAFLEQQTRVWDEDVEYAVKIRGIQTKRQRIKNNELECTIKILRCENERYRKRLLEHNITP